MNNHNNVNNHHNVNLTAMHNAIIKYVIKHHSYSLALYENIVKLINHIYWLNLVEI